eukprot:197395_1
MSNKHLQLLHLSQDKNNNTNPSYLLSQGANPNIRDPFFHKWTPLHYAVSLNKEHFVLQLLQHPKTNATLVDSDGFSPLYWAAKKRSSSTIIKALLSKGCDPNERDMHGMTALFAAVASNKVDNVQCLVSHPSINVNQPNQFGGSALHHTAFATDNVEIADTLVKAGANLFLFDYEKQTPLHVAKRRRRNKLFHYFKRKMEEDEPNWICDVSLDALSETSTNSAEDDEDHKQHIVSDTVPRNIKSYSAQSNQSNQSTQSAFSQQSSSSNSDSPNAVRMMKEKHIHVQAKKPIPQAPVTQHDMSWHTKHKMRMKQLQEKRMQMALKIEQAGLNKQAMELLQEQQIHFQYEHELFYSSLKHEYDKLHYQRDHYMNLSTQLLKTNTQLKHQNTKWRRARKAGHVIVARKTETKHKKEFKKWFKKQLGNDFMEYFEYFVMSGFDDLRTIRYITHEEQLLELGIAKPGHRLHILNKIESYRLSTNSDEVAQAANPSGHSMNVDDLFPNDAVECVEGVKET